MYIIPAIDIINGKCVRLTKGDYGTVKQYADDPVSVAKQFEDAGIKRLHLVDLDGAKARKVINLNVLEGITHATDLQVDFGGGVKTRSDLERVLNAGARQVTAGSIAVNDQEEVLRWITDFGPDKIILGADVLDKKIMVSGWQESSSIQLSDFLMPYKEAGITHVICTDIALDGMLSGPSFSLYQELLTEFPNLKLIASGGVSGMKDLVALKENGLYGAIVGKAFYEGRLSLKDLANF